MSRIEAEKRLDPVEAVLTSVAKPLLGCRSLASALRGDFMGHALALLGVGGYLGGHLAAVRKVGTASPNWDEVG
jgi:hypothetical protein